jgi:heptosyltransferase-2
MANHPVLIVSTNWIGDAVMGMPALQLFHLENPEAKITVLTKPGLKALWQMHPAVDSVQTMGKPFPTARQLRPMQHGRAYIFPNSFRSAFVPWLASIPQRIGLRGDGRRLLLTGIIFPPEGHQQLEYRNILGVQGQLPAPHLDVPEEALHAVKKKLDGLSVSGKGLPLIILLPGAARGPSKRWPPEHFVQLAKKLRASMDALVVLGGGPDDSAACADIATQAGEGVVSLAGKTTIPEWAALLKMSHCVVSNDSGGMHLATAVGAPVVGIYGLTDPAKTGPLGKSLVLQKSTTRSRDIARSSEEAVRALASVTPSEVYTAVCGLMER